jgi:malonyl-CoA/methylmalonyl-CoA synthetase
MVSYGMLTVSRAFAPRGYTGRENPLPVLPDRQTTCQGQPGTLRSQLFYEPIMNNEARLNLYSIYQRHFPSPESVLVITQDGRRYTYADAELYSAQVANYLGESGLKQGDRVSVQVEKSVEALWLYLGTIRAGMVFHPMNTAYTDDELRFFLGDAAPALLVCDSLRADALRRLCEDVGTIAVRTLDADGSGSLMQGARRCSSVYGVAPTRADDIAALVYSSGTTGRPKGIMLSHGNLVENISALVECWGFTRDDCLLHVLPIFHVHGLFVAIGCVLMSGSSMRWLRSFDVDAVLEQLPHSTVMMGVPTYYTRLLASPVFTAKRCAGMRLFISGSAPLLAETFLEFEQRTGYTLLERYGMTETGMNTSNPLHGERRAGTVGLPLPGVTLRVCGADGESLAVNEVGELQVRGGNVFIGYWNMPEQTLQDYTDDGFFKTGDQALIDDRGYVCIVGRSKDMVISGGLNVYPKEVEVLIDALPGVLESAVIGVPDADFGEAVVAIVVLLAGALVSAESVKDAVRARVAKFKVPKRVIFVDDLPRNAMGKVQKEVLRKRYSQV